MEKILKVTVSLGIEDLKITGQAVGKEELHALLEIANPLISAKTLYKVSYIDQKLDNTVIIDGIRFQSRVLKKNLEKAERVFPYVVTIGPALERKIEEGTDLIEKYYLDIIGNIALVKARKYLEDHLCSQFALTGLSFMSPGSLADWPIEEQSPLFSVLNRAEEWIGVTLTENLLMVPTKSVSGIYFPTEVSFYSCQLCPHEKCEGRKAPYDQNLANKYQMGAETHAQR